MTRVFRVSFIRAMITQRERRPSASKPRFY